MRADHLDALDAQLDELDKFDREIRAMAASLPVLLRKARARVRALRRELEPPAPPENVADCGRKDCLC